MNWEAAATKQLAIDPDWLDFCSSWSSVVHHESIQNRFLNSTMVNQSIKPPKPGGPSSWNDDVLWGFVVCSREAEGLNTSATNPTQIPPRVAAHDSKMHPRRVPQKIGQPKSDVFKTCLTNMFWDNQNLFFLGCRSCTPAVHCGKPSGITEFLSNNAECWSRYCLRRLQDFAIKSDGNVRRSWSQMCRGVDTFHRLWTELKMGPPENWQSYRTTTMCRSFAGETHEFLWFFMFDLCFLEAKKNKKSVLSPWRIVMLGWFFGQGAPLCWPVSKCWPPETVGTMDSMGFWTWMTWKDTVDTMLQFKSSLKMKPVIVCEWKICWRLNICHNETSHMGLSPSFTWNFLWSPSPGSDLSDLVRESAVIFYKKNNEINETCANNVVRTIINHPFGNCFYHGDLGDSLLLF